jgi:hypothetical protein
MQKVVGSSPIIRFKSHHPLQVKPCNVQGFSRFEVVVAGDTIGASQVPCQVRGTSGPKATLGGTSEHGGVALGGASEVVGVETHRHLRVRVTGQACSTWAFTISASRSPAVSAARASASSSGAESFALPASLRSRRRTDRALTPTARAARAPVARAARRSTRSSASAGVSFEGRPVTPAILSEKRSYALFFPATC